MGSCAPTAFKGSASSVSEKTLLIVPLSKRPCHRDYEHLATKRDERQ